MAPPRSSRTLRRVRSKSAATQTEIMRKNDLFEWLYCDESMDMTNENLYRNSSGNDSDYELPPYRTANGDFTVVSNAKLYPPIQMAVPKPRSKISKFFTGFIIFTLFLIFISDL